MPWNAEIPGPEFIVVDVKQQLLSDLLLILMWRGNDALHEELSEDE